MRLEKIRLAGFKSFVDPTTVSLPSNLAAIVGPNGCGKSNIIDAVRWVMGESSAKMLRGESMADVIFNGSSARQPVGVATIELLFDNSDGSAGGQYQPYQQIAVKRQVSRDGQSNYFLNNSRCRRRDITDLFLGTGLGPRSYSIIEQGTISRLIEARPEELRVFLEEAAGISKYKERRRETEHRIARTRENLDRLNDVRDELNKQLQHLQRQAKVAEKYQQFKHEERQLQAELLALQWQRCDQERQTYEQQSNRQDTALQAEIAKQRQLEANLEQQRVQRQEVQDQVDHQQDDLYQLGTEIARREQQLQHARERLVQQRQDLVQTEQQQQQIIAHQAQDREQQQQRQQRLAQDRPALEQAQQADKTAKQQLQIIEEQRQHWQNQWDSFQRQAAEPVQIAQVERAKINQLERQVEQVQRRLQRQESELAQLDVSAFAQELAALEEQLTLQQEQLDQAQLDYDDSQEQVYQLRQAIKTSRHTLDQLQTLAQRTKGRQASLDALQQAALGKDQQQLTAWLDQQGLTQAPRLAEQIEVDERWQQATETVLGPLLQAVCVSQFEHHRTNDWPQTQLILLETDTNVTVQTSSKESGLPARMWAGSPLSLPHLLDQVKAPWSLETLLGNVHLAETLDDALAMRTQLAPYQSVITPEGAWLGSNWLRLGQEQDHRTGILARERERRALAEQMAQQASQLEIEEERLLTLEDDLHQQESQGSTLQQQLQQNNHSLRELQTQFAAKQARAEQIQHRADTLQQEIAEAQQQMMQEQEEMATARLKLHAALENSEQLEQQRMQLKQQGTALQQQQQQAKVVVAECQSRAHQLAIQVEADQSSLNSLEQSLARLTAQLQQLSTQQERLQQSMAIAEEPLEEQQMVLEEQLEQRLMLEDDLRQLRQQLEQIDASFTQTERQRQSIERQVETLRSQLNAVRLQHQDALVRTRTFAEQLQEQQLVPTDLLQKLPATANEEDWKQQLEQITARIQRLGAINLAAIDEYQEQSQRKHYLDAQHQDLINSLDTLETAIRKIDRETRARFKATFDQVNSQLQVMFPKLFGGGSAYLELTGDELLDAGVAVMARPPGKRNSSIHLLSGGEKALTAVALVFAIFELNPAPFCMLDEVDAPLDDANVGRFCALVKSMSERVQFIFITHNKVTMETADQLLGVTMSEPGVSRLVSVDVEAAVELAAV